MDKSIVKHKNNSKDIKAFSWRAFSLRRKLIIFFSAIVVIPISLITMINYYTQTQEIKKNVSHLAETLIVQGANNIDYYFNDANELLNSIFLNRIVMEQIDVLTDDTNNSYEKIRAEINIQRQLESFTQAKEYIKNFYIVDNEGEIYSSFAYVNSETLLEKEWFKAVYQGDNKKIYQYVSDSTDYTGTINFDISSVSSIVVLLQYQDYERGKKIGVIGIEIKFDIIQQILDNMNQFSDSQTIIMNQQRKNISNESDVFLDEQEIDLIYNQTNGSFIKNNKLFVFDTIKSNNWKLVQVNELNQLLESPRKSASLTVLIGILFVVIAEIFAIYSAYQISKPVSDLIFQMKKVEVGELDSEVQVTNLDEIGQLSLTFNKMVKRLDDLIQRIQLEEKEKRTIEYQLLQEQMNPHFLYNTLNSMVWLSRIQKTPMMTEGLKALIFILKNTIHNGNEYITVTEEIKFIKNYLLIQKLRYGDKFEVEYQVSKDVSEYKLLKLLVQPILENAILHGIKLEEFDNNIKISATKDEEYLLFCVQDNGVGMEEKEIKTLLNTKDKSKDGLNHIGLVNIKQRIHLYYGQTAKLWIESKKDFGTKVFIKLPLIR